MSHTIGHIKLGQQYTWLSGNEVGKTKGRRGANASPGVRLALPLPIPRDEGIRLEPHVKVLHLLEIGAGHLIRKTRPPVEIQGGETLRRVLAGCLHVQGEKLALSRQVNQEIATLNLFGLDINPFLVRTCQMNLVMHGDGSANVSQSDSLYSPKEWDNQEAAKKAQHGKFDVVVTNPPFGGKAQVDDPHLLAQYELTKAGAREPRSSMPAEQLFVEAAWKFLKPGGRLAIVLPDTVRDRLKRSGFRWTPSLGCWQAYRNDRSIRLAQEFAGLE